MGKTLIIAEKPSVGADIAKALGVYGKQNGYYENEQYIVTWAVGHLIGLKYPEEHNPEYKEWKLEHLPFSFSISDSLKVLPDTAMQFKVVKQLINRADIDMLVNAGDAGREGLLIQEWIYRMAGNRKPIKMLWISSFTEEAILQAFNGNLKNRADFMGLLNAAEARAEGDHLLGINYSRLLTLTKAGKGINFAYGRCQTPLLNLIVQREEEIANFKPEPYYNIEVTYQQGFKGSLVDQDKKQINLKTEEDAIITLQSLENQGTVISFITEQKKKKAPLLYNLAELQKAMGSQYGFSPDQTLQIAQNLYEKHKILSYPRTDSRYLSTDLYHEIEEHLQSCNFGMFAQFVSRLDIVAIKPDKSYFNDLKVTDHHALIPTINANMSNIYQKLSDEERKVFDAVIKSFISIFLPEYKYTVTELLVENAGHCFCSRGKTILQLGYKELLNVEPGAKDKEETDDSQLIPKLSEGSSILLDSGKVIDKMTKAPARYTVSSVIDVMEKYNIGTSATRAEIIKKLLNPKRQFVRLEKNKYYATDFGRSYIGIVPDDLKDVKLTEHFEENLAKIESGTLSKEVFLQELLEDLKKNISKFSQENGQRIENTRFSIGNCPKCGKPVYGNSKAYGCSGYIEGCDFVIWKTISGRPVTEMMAKMLLTKGITGKTTFKAKSGKIYPGVLYLSSEKKVEIKY